MRGMYTEWWRLRVLQVHNIYSNIEAKWFFFCQNYYNNCTSDSTISWIKYYNVHFENLVRAARNLEPAESWESVTSFLVVNVESLNCVENQKLLNVSNLIRVSSGAGLSLVYESATRKRLGNYWSNFSYSNLWQCALHCTTEWELTEMAELSEQPVSYGLSGK